MTSDPNRPHLKRVLGRFDLVLLFVVAVFNLNVVPSIAANGGVTIWLWIISLLLFFWPQGIAVIELAHRYPGEGGVYLWAKEVFGDFHGFRSEHLALDHLASPVLLAPRHRRHRTRPSLSRRRRCLPLGERSFRRLPRIPLWLVLLDQQHALRADGHALFRRRVGVCARSRPSGSSRQQALRRERFPRFACVAHPAQHPRPRRREVDQ